MINYRNGEILMSNFAELKYADKTYEIPVVEGTEKEIALDISKLRPNSGLITLDSGYKNTGACKSGITFLNGEEGILRYRGYPIEQIAENSNFLEVSYLLLNGELPSKQEFKNYEHLITNHTLVHEDIKNFFKAYPSSSHPMGVLQTMVAALSAFYPESLNPARPPEDFEMSIIRLIAKMPTLISWIYKKNIGHPIMYPRNDLSYTENFLYMMFANRTEEYKINPVVVDALDKLLILHADHEQNCSTSTVRIVGSSQANIYAAISAGISALWGPLHGGANQAVLEMLAEIQAGGGVENIGAFIDKAKDKNDPFRLMGFGHRVYKNFDPRATIIKKAADNVLEALGINDPMLDIAKKLEQIALEDEYFKARNLYPNVDFYSGIIYKALDIPVDMFTVMFALGRLPGWIAQWKEMLASGEPIGRPRQVYVGANERNYVDINKR
jgi:citrate synthase